MLTNLGGLVCCRHCWREVFAAWFCSPGFPGEILSVIDYDLARHISFSDKFPKHFLFQGMIFCKMYAFSAFSLLPLHGVSNNLELRWER